MTPLDEFDVHFRLCDDDGMVSSQPIENDSSGDKTYLDRHNRLARMTRSQWSDPLPPMTEPFACTGHAHLAGAHIGCTSKAHRQTGLDTTDGV